MVAYLAQCRMLTACCPELAAVDSYRLIVAPLICTVAVLRSSRSDVGERVVAKLGQDVAGLADDLAGLR